MQITFIIPFFNGRGGYISHLLDSIYQQDIPENEYEVIVINDCSTDKQSLSPVNRYSSLHQNIRIIHNSTNLRCGCCRNIGVKAAKGKYIWFVDQDDYIEHNCLASLLDKCESGNLDILMFNYRNVSDDGLYNEKRALIHKDSPILSGLEYINDICGGDFWNSEYDTNVWHSIFCRDFLIENEVYSPEISYCEDMIVSLHAIIAARRVQSIKEDYYRYRYNPKSVFHTEVGKKGRAVFDSSLFAGTHILTLANLVPVPYQTLKETIISGGIWRINSFTKGILKIDKNELKLFYAQINIHPEVIDKAMPYLTMLNKLFLRHPTITMAINILTREALHSNTK
ncbi:MAG: glycosyltransferase [Bacteroidales bacterium]|nr:glycosyltransferase [Candidatus Cacconaster merdequi]